MKLHAWLVAFLLFVVVPQAEPQASSSALVLTHVTVIDATGAPAKPNMNVVMANGRIIAAAGILPASRRTTAIPPSPPRNSRRISKSSAPCKEPA